MNSGGPDMELGNLEALIERWQSTVPVLDKLIADDPRNQRYQQVKAMLQSNIAIILRDMGRLDEAISPLKAATETLQTQAEQLDYASESYLPVALNHYELASTFIQLERWQEALEALNASDAIVATILQKDPVFTPARGHLLDALHARIQLLLRQANPDAETMRQVALQSLELARDLASKNLDVAEYQIELPRAINDVALSQLNSEQFSVALETVKESQELLENIRVELDKTSNQQPLPPEYRICRKDALLIEARAIIGLDSESISDAHRASLGKLIEQARQFGAAPEELKAFDEVLNDKSKR
jgi:tetratricopeptide (TPR) repeat protein